MQEEKRQRVVDCDETAEQCLGRAVEPVGILERRMRGTCRDAPHDPHQKVAGSEADQHAVQPRERAPRRLTAEQVQEKAEVLPELRPNAEGPRRV